MMFLAWLRHRSRRALPGLLWLALVLPLAQLAATGHAMGHAAEAAAEQAQTHGPGQDGHEPPCELCLAAAALAGGGMVGTLPAGPDIAASHVAASPVQPSVWRPAPAQPYLSRAPPSFGT
jgi:hypothetical protein